MIDIDRGCTILVDKPLEWTSFDVVNKIRYALRKTGINHKIKVGHAGTLDPRATGLLIICIGPHTKKIQAFQNFSKRYTGEIYLGKTTLSYDSEESPNVHFDVDHIDLDLIEKTRHQFLGTIEQIPPQFSAIKIKGKPAYLSARKGKVVEMKSRRVKIFDFEVQIKDWPILNFQVSCSKGTYIRTLAHDYGKALDSGAYLLSLRRTRIGPFDITNAWDLDQFLSKVPQTTISSAK